MVAVDFTGEQSSPLVNTASISAVCEKQARRYAFLNHVQMLLGTIDLRNSKGERPHRTRYCHVYKSYGSDAIVVRLNENIKDSRASFSGLQTCGSVHACPVCANREAAADAKFIKKALKWARRNNKKDVMLTLTARHDMSMSLEELETKFKGAWQTFTSHYAFKKLKKMLGIEHWIANFEAPFGENGWHYHKHILLFCDFEMLSDATAQADFTALWMRCLEIHGLSAVAERAAWFSSGSSIGDQYLTKIGITVVEKDGKIDYEMTGSQNKDSRSHWQLLEESFYGNTGSGQLYLEYVEHMTGKNFLTTSHHLRDIVEADNEAAAAEETETEAAAAEETEMQNWVEISPYWWEEVVKPARAMGDVLKCAAKHRNINKLRELLWDLQEKMIKSGVLDDYHRRYRFMPASSADFAEGIRRL